MYNLLYQFTQFPVSIEYLRVRKKKGHSCYRWTNRPCNHGTMHYVTDWKYCTKFSICYL